MTERMNSKEYWDNRFATRDWEEHDGEGQSTFFARLAVKNFPEWLSTELNQNEWEFRDYGCATGEGTAYLARCFPSCIMTGIDISEEAVKQASEKTPNCEFVAGDITESIQETDVVFSSNTLEHLKKPKKLLKMLVQSAKKYAILLLPFEDDLGIEEHFNMFEASFFPMTIESHALCCMRIIDCRNTETGLKYWNGKQILVVYVNTAYRSLESGLIADFYKENVSNLQDERLLLQEQIKDTTDKIKKYENQLQEQREENDRQYKVISEKEIEYQNNLLNKEAEFQEERNEWKRTEQQRIAEFQTERDKLKQDVQQKVAEKEAEFQIERDKWKQDEQQTLRETEIKYKQELIEQEEKYNKELEIKEITCKEKLIEQESNYKQELMKQESEYQQELLDQETEFERELLELRAEKQRELSEQEVKFEITLNERYAKYQQDLITLNQFENKRDAQYYEQISQIKREADMLSYWLDVAAKSKPLRIAHFITQCKHALIGTKEEKKESRRWLRGDRSFVPKFSYVYQSEVCATQISKSLEMISQNRNPVASIETISRNETADEAMTDIQAFEETLNQYGKNTVIVFPELVDWNIPLFQRPQQMAMAFAKLGIMFVYVTPNGNDNAHEIKTIMNNCILVPPEKFEQVMNILLNRNLEIILDICSTDNRHFMPWVEKYTEQGCKVLYEYIDEISDDITGKVPKETYERHHELLKDRNIYVVATADKLYNEVIQIRGNNINCLNSGNGVDLEHFRVEKNVRKVPRNIRPIVKKEKPVIGYFGAIANWFDFEMVEYAAKQRKDYEFLMIGPNYGSHDLECLQELKKIPNLHFVGTVDYKILPYVATYFTVATIPFLLNDITESTSPIKLFEYMAMDKPVVTTAMRECFKYPIVRIAKDKEDFVTALDEAVAKAKDEQFLKEVAEVAEKNSWLKKAEEIIRLIGIDTVEA